MARILDGINSPEQVKRLSISDLEQLAAEIREELITVLSSNGGHLGPNLGVVELTIAMHYVFETPKDHFLFDVSHQAYVHKLLTGRRERFRTIRTPGGLNGFMLRTESPHDCYGAGHAGTALSAALGMAVARDKAGGKEHVVARGRRRGLHLRHHLRSAEQHRAPHQAAAGGAERQRVVHRQERRRHRQLSERDRHQPALRLPARARRQVRREAGRQAVALQMARKAEEAAKSMLWPSVIFEELGLKYYGPIDGHDISTLIKTFEFLKKQDRPVLLHVLTQKGKRVRARACRSRRSSTAWGRTIRRPARPNRSAGVRIRRSSPTPW